MVLYSCAGVGRVVCVLGKLLSTADVMFKYCCSVHCGRDTSCHADGDGAACRWVLFLVYVIKLSFFSLKCKLRLVLMLIMLILLDLSFYTAKCISPIGLLLYDLILLLWLYQLN
jgi:hypothetical protein